MAIMLDAIMIAVMVLVSSVVACTASVGCMDADGMPLDWWIALKAPEGSRYAFIYSNQRSPVFHEADGLADLSGNPLAATVGQIYPSADSDASMSFVTWNDQPWGKKYDPSKLYYAHSKGVIGYQDDQGFWLVHSNPDFPDDPSQAAYSGINNCTASGKCGPNYGQQKYAQSYLCVTLDGQTLEKVAEALEIAHLVIADSNTDSTANQYPNLHSLATTRYDPDEVPEKANISQPITTVGGEQLLQFAMSPSEKGDDVYLYEQLVEPVLQSGLLVETWIESPVFPSYCLEDPSSLPHPPKYPYPDPPFEFNTYVVRTVKISDDLQWDNPHTKNEGDHSKWAVTFLPPPPPQLEEAGPAMTSRKLLSSLPSNATAEGNDGYSKSVCIGDINRAGHQLQRGGGTVCFVANDALWETWYGIVYKWDKCHKQRDD